MKDYFAEKTAQIEPSALDAFGVSIHSRYGKAREIIEMISFCRIAALNGVGHLVEKVFYDSKADMCTFEFRGSLDQYSEDAEKLKLAAGESISQFDWFGFVEHGKPLDSETAGLVSEH